MKSGVFDKKAFIQSVRDNLKNLYRKTLEEADQQEIFQAVSFAVKDVINDRWLATQQVFDKEDRVLHVDGISDGTRARQ